MARRADRKRVVVIPSSFLIAVSKRSGGHGFVRYRSQPARSALTCSCCIDRPLNAMIGMSLGLFIRFQSTGDFPPVEIRKAQIQHDEIGCRRPDEIERAAPPASVWTSKPAPDRYYPVTLARIGVVFDDKELFAVRHVALKDTTGRPSGTK